MADILCLSKATDSFLIYLGNLDTEWTTDNRRIEWFLSKNKNSGYTNPYHSLLLGGVSKSTAAIFDKLDSGTSYYIKAEVYQTVSEDDTRPVKLLATLGPVRVTTYPKLPEAEILSKKPESSSIRITNSGNTDGYIVDICDNASGTNPIMTVTLSGESPKLTLTNLAANTNYHIFIYPFIYLSGDKYYDESISGRIYVLLSTEGEEVSAAAPPVITLGDGTTEEEVWGIGISGWFWYAAKFYIYPADENCEEYALRYKKESDTEWINWVSYASYENNPYMVVDGLDMCSKYEFQARTYSQKNGYSEWSESYHLQTLGRTYIGESVRYDEVSFSKEGIDEMLAELKSAGLDGVYDFKVSIAAYFNGELFDAALLSINDIKKLPLDEYGYYLYTLELIYGSGEYRLKVQTYTVYNGKMYTGRDWFYGTDGSRDIKQTLTASKAVAGIICTRIDAGFEVEWDKIANTEKYRLIVADAEGNSILDVYETSTGRTLANLDYSSVYTVSVRVLGKGKDVWSEETKITIATAPPQPIISAEYNKETKALTVDWSLSDTDSYATYVYINLYSNDDMSSPVRKYTYSSGGASGTAVFENIAPGVYTIKAATDYNYGGILIQCVDSTGADYTAVLEITAEGLRPENFYWTYKKVQNEDFNLTADEWNAFTEKVNEFRRYLGLTDRSFSKAAAGEPFYADMYNSAGEAIRESGDYGTYIPEVIPNQKITAYMLNALESELNAIN